MFDLVRRELSLQISPGANAHIVTSTSLVVSFIPTISIGQPKQHKPGYISPEARRSAIVMCVRGQRISQVISSRFVLGETSPNPNVVGDLTRIDEPHCAPVSASRADNSVHTSHLSGGPIPLCKSCSRSLRSSNPFSSENRWAPTREWQKQPFAARTRAEGEPHLRRGHATSLHLY